MVKKITDNGARRGTRSAAKLGEGDRGEDSQEDWSNPPPAPLLKPQKVDISKSHVQSFIRRSCQHGGTRD